LRVDALLNLGVGPTASAEAFALSGGAASDTESGVEFGLGLGFEEEGDDDGCECAVARAGLATISAILLAQRVELGFPELADARVEDLLEAMAGGRVGKDMAGELLAIEAAIRPDESVAEGLADFLQSGLAGLNDLAGEEVGINDRDAAVAQQIGASGFAHADPAS
jgi:hypothetical protein